MNNLGFCWIVSLVLVFEFPDVKAKCTLAPLNAESRQDRTIAYVCIHGDLSDLNDVPAEAEWIEFTVARLHHIPADAFSRFPNLRRLTFYNCELREIHLDAFRGLNNLEWLVMSNTKLNVARAIMFQHIPNLKMLTLDSTGLIYIEPQVFKILSMTLEVLNLRNNDLDCLPSDAFSSMKRLKAIEIDDNPWLCDCKSVLDNYFEKRNIIQRSVGDSSSYHHVRQWNHWQNTTYQSRAMSRVYDCMAVLDFPSLPPAPSQEIIDKTYDYRKIEWREVTISSISYLDRLPEETGWIELFDVQIPTIKRYSFFRFGNSLRSIVLRNCGVEHIESEAFAGLHKLERLAIIGARFPVVRAFWFRDLTRLTDLILRESMIERFESNALDHMRNLQRLDLRSNRLGCLLDQDLDGLYSLKRLESGDNPWRCLCRQNLESYLGRRGIGYEISNSRSDRVGCIPDDYTTSRPSYEYQTFYNTTTSGKIRWSWGYETHAHRRPTVLPPTRPPPVIIETKPPSITHRSGCREVPAHQHHYHHRYNHLRGLTYICSFSSVEDLQRIPSNVETIIFSKSMLHTLPCDAFRNFGALKRLEFLECSIQNIENRAFYGLPKLEYLVIHDTYIDVVYAEWFVECRNLQHLDLSNNNIGRVENGVLDLLTRLVSFDVTENRLNCIGSEHLEKLRYLRELNLAGNPWTCLCAMNLQRLINDRNIHCAKNCLDDVLKAQKQLSWGCHNTGVKISHPTTTMRPVTIPPTTMMPVGISNSTGTCSSSHEHTHYRCCNGDIFITANIPSYVRSIEICDSYIPYLPAQSFSRFENLTELILRNCSIKDIDPNAFHGLYRLEKLIIRNNRLTIVRNGFFENCRNLNWLDLSRNSLIEIETGVFDGLDRLQYLNLEHNSFQCIYTSVFIQLPRLDTLEFGNNPLKWRCWQDLRQFLQVRAIGYTYWKCPHDSRSLVRNLQNEKNTGQTGASTGAPAIDRINPIFHALIAAIVFLMYDQ